MMTVEERQVRAWIQTVLRRAAVRWFIDQRHQHASEVALEPREKEEVLWEHADPHSTDSDIAVSMWMAHCLRQLTPRDQAILQAINHGWTQKETAQALHCTDRTVRRAIRRIRSQCPYS